MSEGNELYPKEHANPNWYVKFWERLSACDNRPGMRMIWVKVLDANLVPLAGVKVRFDTEPSSGIAYDHPNTYGITDEEGRVEWRHLGIPTRYRIFMLDDAMPQVSNIRTDLGNEYCRGEGWPPWAGWRPVNRPGVYSYRLTIVRRW